MDVHVDLRTNHLPGVGAAIEAILSQVVRKTGFEIEARAKAAIQTGEKSGRMYGAHQASAPGQAPANDGGGLAGGIQFLPDGALEGVVNVAEDYAPTLEMGGVHVAARPFLTPARDAAEPGFVAAVAELGARLQERFGSSE